MPIAAFAEQSRPNILWISCEDISPHLRCYGYPEAITPNLDRLAAQGVRYTNASTVTGVCATCRASIITGMYPSTLGNQFMRCSVKLPDHVKLFPSYLKKAGYYCTNNSKTDYNVTGSHARCWHESGRKAHFRNRPTPETPFFAVFNFTNTHESRVFKYKRPKNLTDEEIHDPAKMKVPPYYPDTEIARKDWAHYYDNITSMDKLAGNLLQQLEDDNLADNTIVIYWSDHGAGLPRAKRWIYESGTHVPLIVRIPEAVRVNGQGQPNTVNEELVSLMDLGPTTLNLAGIDVPSHMHGQAFLGKERAKPREQLFKIRDRMDERYDTIRAVRGKRYKYIRNFQSFKPWFQTINYMEQEHTMKELRRLHAAGELHPEAAQFMADSKPLEELYDLQNDPHEVKNLIAEAATNNELNTALLSLRKQLWNWMLETRDTGLIPEAELATREETNGTRHAILQAAGAENLIQELIRVNELACRADDVGTLVKAYSHDDAAVRFWAITGLANAAASDAKSKATIETALEDQSASVRVAAARASWKIGKSDQAISVLDREVRSREEFLSLAAIHVIDEMGEDGRSLADAVTWVHENGKKYPQRVAKYLLDSHRFSRN